MSTYIPKFSQKAWETVLKDHPCQIHPGLALFRLFKRDRSEAKTKDGLQRVANIKPFASRVLLDRQEQQLRDLERRGYRKCLWKQVSESRMACGLGIPSLSDNGLFLDRVSGVPYLPGSILKGIAQDQALLDMDGLEKQEERRKRKRSHKSFISAFGAQSAEPKEELDAYWQACSGSVVFFDAFPDLSAVSQPFEIDIVNPHYGDYYQSKGKTPPADYLSPKPSLFITLRKGIPFYFALAACSVSVDLKDSDGSDLTIRVPVEELLNAVKAWLQTALRDLGAGGKTAVGYGYFGEAAEIP